MPQALTKAITQRKFSHLAFLATRHHAEMEHKAWLSYVRTGQVPEKLKAEVWASDPETLKACVDEDNIDLVLRHFGQDPQELTMKILRELKQDGVLLNFKDDDADGGDNDWDDTHFMRPSGDRGGIGSDAVASGAAAAAAGDAVSLAFDPNAMGAPAGTLSPTGSALDSGQFAPASSGANAAGSLSSDASNFHQSPYITSVADAQNYLQATQNPINPNNPNSGLYTPVGNGQCVKLVQDVTPSIGPASTWKMGDPVMGNTSLQPGTAIATFNFYGEPGTNGYGPRSDPGGVTGQSHAAIYLGQDDTGIQVLNQYHTHENPKGIATIQTIPWNSWNGSITEAGNKYFTILNSK